MTISIALQGLSVAQRGFEVASQNIANVNTPGYSRQQLDLSARSAPEQGVQVLNINRIVDEFAAKQLWSTSAAFKSTESYSTFAGQIDNLLANSTTSIATATDQFFASVQAGVDDPASTPNRELILEQSEALVRRFGEIDRQLHSLNESVNTRIEGAVSSVNEMVGLVATLNDNIRLAEARGTPSNVLEDQRDQLILSITEQVGGIVQTSTGNSDINLYVGNGQPLVIGNNASTLIARQGSPDINDIDIFVNISGQEISVRDQISEGEIGGMLSFRDDMLVPSWNELGRLAIVFADTVNQQQIKGVDLDGNMGSNWFSDPANVGDIRAFSSNASPLDSASTVVIRDSSLLNASDYEVKFGSGDTFIVTRTTDGKTFTQADFSARDLAQPTISYQDMTLEQDATTGQLRLNLGGVDITLETSNGVPFSKNDRVLIQPVRFGAELMKVELTSGRELAFASPVRAETAVDNSGTLAVELTEIANAAIDLEYLKDNPLQLVFSQVAGNNTYAVYQIDSANPSNPVMLSTGNAYVQGQPIPLNGFEITLKGVPQPGDKVNLTFNTDAVSDNRNALQLSNLQQQRLVGGATYQDNYGRLVERIGTKANSAFINLQANEAIMLNAEAVRDGISGVNLDEEAADIIKFQQQYQAASQVIATARSLFDTLLSATGG